MNSPAFTRLQPSTGSFTIRGAFTRHRVPVYSVNTGWSESVKDRLGELVHLETGWDGYRAEAISFEIANFALSMLDAVCFDDTPAPQIIPGPNGELQVEWHTEQGDVEVLVRAPYDVYAWRSLEDDENGEEVELTSDFQTIVNWIQEITEPAIALRAAA